MARNYAWWTFCSFTEHITNSARLHRALYNDPNIKLEYFWLPRVDVRISRGNHKVLANYTFSQFGVTQYLAVPVPTTWPELRLDVGCECGHLQQGRLGCRFVCLI